MQYVAGIIHHRSCIHSKSTASVYIHHRASERISSYIYIHIRPKKKPAPVCVFLEDDDADGVYTSASYDEISLSPLRRSFLAANLFSLLFIHGKLALYLSLVRCG